MRRVLAYGLNFYFFISLFLFGILSVRPIHAELTLRNKALSSTIEADIGRMSLTNLNPWINRWYILQHQNGGKIDNYHLENVLLDNKLELHADGLLIVNNRLQKRFVCRLWAEGAFSIPDELASHRNPFFPLCHNLIYLRLSRPSDTELSSTEKATAILRRYGSWGEKLINVVKPFMVRLAAETAESQSADASDVASAASLSAQSEQPHPAQVAIRADGKIASTGRNSLGVALTSHAEQIRYGYWYPTALYDDVYVSLFTPASVPPEILSTFPDRVGEISADEKDKLIYLVAYDLDQYGVNYVIGREHPGIDPEIVALDSGPAAKYVVPVGKVPPYALPHSVSVFIGGFKNRHGMIKRGPHRGKIYGYVESGLELRRLSPGLATFVVSKKGEVDIIKWPHAEWQQLDLRKELLGARQNGVPIVNDGAPGRLVNKWGWGNWSGDANGNLRTLRSGVCIQKRGNRRFLVFAGFTYATPSTMSRVFQAYGCQSAMHLDMNAYMYLHNAVFKFAPAQALSIEYLHKDMEYPKGIKKHRYILDNNNRDFFYVFRRDYQNDESELVSQ